MKKLKYNGYSIVMQEVPNEVSLAINISGCPHKCEGCHSKYLWKYDGEYLIDDIEKLLNQYSGLITCVCFMGGDQNQDDLLYCINMANKKELKTCLYTGVDDINMINKETTYSGAVIPEVSLISESTNIFIHIKSKIQIKGNSSPKLIGIKM